MNNTNALQNTLRSGKASILHDASANDMDAIKKVQAASRSFNLGEMKVFGEVPVSSFTGQSGGKRWFGDSDLLVKIDENMKRQHPVIAARDKKGSCGCGETHQSGSNAHLKVAIIILFIVLAGHHLWFTTRKEV